MPGSSVVPRCWLSYCTSYCSPKRSQLRPRSGLAPAPPNHRPHPTAQPPPLRAVSHPRLSFNRHRGSCLLPTAGANLVHGDVTQAACRHRPLRTPPPSPAREIIVTDACRTGRSSASGTLVGPYNRRRTLFSQAVGSGALGCRLRSSARGCQTIKPELQ